MRKNTYAILDAGGYVTSVSNSQPPPGVAFVEIPEGVTVTIGPSKVKYSGGRFIQTNESWLPPRSYAMNRASEYPSVTDQLDMLWHAMDQGAMPVVEPFYSQIKKVKERFPKQSA